MTQDLVTCAGTDIDAPCMFYRRRPRDGAWCCVKPGRARLAARDGVAELGRDFAQLPQRCPGHKPSKTEEASP